MTNQGDIVEISYVPDEDEHNGGDEAAVHHVEEAKEKPAKSTTKKKSSTKKLQKKIDQLEEALETRTGERDDFRDKYLRSLAEVDNFRKRIKKEKEEFQKYVLGDFILGLLEVVDNFERALKAKMNTENTNDEKSIISGVEMIYKQMMDLLKKNNVQEIDAQGKTFDPNIHQALSREEKEGIDDPIVLEVYQKGFNYNNKLLRPALVKVAVPIQEEEPEDNTSGSGESSETEE